MCTQGPGSLAADLARHLVDDGAFVLDVDPGEFGTAHLQVLVDVGWAARQASRMLDRSVRVSSTERGGRVVVTAEFGDVAG